MHGEAKMNLNVLTLFTYSWRYYLLHPWKFLSRCAKNLRDAWMRATRGWCRRDVWDMDEYLLKIIPEMLELLATEGISYPDDRFDEESWPEYLKKTAQMFRNASLAQRMQRNEYTERFRSESRRVRHKDEAGDGTTTVTICPDSKTLDELFQLYFDREKEILEWRKAQKNEAFNRLSRVFFDLVD